MKLLLIPVIALAAAMFAAVVTMNPAAGLVTFIVLQAAYAAVRIALGVTRLVNRPTQRVVVRSTAQRVYQVR